MSAADDLEKRQVKPLATLQPEAIERFERELDEVRSAAAACYEQALGRLREVRWVPLDAVSTLIGELSSMIDSERERSTTLASDLEAARREVEAIRAQCHESVHAAREAALRERNDAVVGFARELRAARELARAAAAAEVQAREELAAVQTRSQETIDRQMLELIALKRESDEASVEVARLRAEAEQGQRTVARPAEPATNRVLPTPQDDVPPNERTPEFAAIEAVLAGSPPLGAWHTEPHLRGREAFALS